MLSPFVVVSPSSENKPAHTHLERGGAGAAVSSFQSELGCYLLGPYPSKEGMYRAIILLLGIVLVVIADFAVVDFIIIAIDFVVVGLGVVVGVT